VIGPRYALSALAAALSVSTLFSGGCASLWAASMLIEGKPTMETKGGSETVHVPGVRERLPVKAFIARNGVEQGGTGLTFDCTVTQTGQEIEYVAATRYDGSWKLWTALAFLGEGAIVALNFHEGVRGLGSQVGVGWMAADAVGSGLLFFAPERDVYEQRPRSQTITVNRVCPEGLTLEARGVPVPIGADGSASELGQKLFDEQMTAPVPALRLHVAGASADLPISPANRCYWASHRPATHLVQSYCTGVAESLQPGTQPGMIEVTFDVPVGTGTRTKIRAGLR